MVFLAGVLLPDSNVHAAVRVLNQSDREYNTGGGQEVGRAKVA